MELVEKNAKVEELLKEGDFILVKADMAMATTPKQLCNQWQKAVKKGYGQKIDVDEYWETLIIGTAIDLREKIKKTSNTDRRTQLVRRWREDFDTCFLQFDVSLKIKQLLENKTSELKEMIKTNYIDTTEKLK